MSQVTFLAGRLISLNTPKQTVNSYEKKFQRFRKYCPYCWCFSRSSISHALHNTSQVPIACKRKMNESFSCIGSKIWGIVPGNLK